MSAHVDAVISSSCCLSSAGALVKCLQSVQKSAGFKVAASFQLERLKLVELVEVSAAAGRAADSLQLGLKVRSVVLPTVHPKLLGVETVKLHLDFGSSQGFTSNKYFR